MSKTKSVKGAAGTTIIYNGKKIHLSKCLKKDARSYSKGCIYLKACDKKYAEFTCTPKGMIIHLTNTPDERKYCVKGYRHGAYKIPNDIYNTYHLERTETSSLYQLENNTYFLRGRLTKEEKDSFVAPVIPDKTKFIYNEINFHRLVNLGTSLTQRFTKVKEHGEYVVTYYNNGQQYISLKKATEEETKKLFSLKELKRIYGPYLRDFYGNELSYIAESKNKNVYISKEFTKRLNMDTSNCRVLYDPDEEIIYFTLPETISDLSGDPIDPIKESPVKVVTEEATDMEMMKALLEEFEIFKESTNRIFEEYKNFQKEAKVLKKENEEIKKENKELKKALKEQNNGVTINGKNITINGKPSIDDMEEIFL